MTANKEISCTSHSAWSSDYSANGMPNKDFIEMIHKLGPYLMMAARKLKTNVFAVRGTSGIGVANAIRMLDLNLDFIMVRKEGESHHGKTVEPLTRSDLCFSTYIFLDDFISSGYTREAVRKAIPDAKMVGQVLYNALREDFREDFREPHTTLNWGNNNFPTLA
jgi:adenine/guanine phosphoribosyltransferase-like PRPP-binding protein